MLRNKAITLKWVRLIKARLREEKYKSNSDVLSFIKPILKYGNSEERRIYEELKRDKAL